VQSEPDEVPAVSNEMGANVFLDPISGLTADQILPQVGGQASATDGAMILDENTLRSLHEFIESQGLSASQNQVRTGASPLLTLLECCGRTNSVHPKSNYLS